MSTSTRPILIVVLAIVPLLMGFDPFRKSNTNVEEGNAKLGAGKPKEALGYYDKAAKELPDEAGVHYNRGIALSKLSKLEEAKEALIKGTMASDPSLKAKSFYNLGNVQLKLKRYKDAIDAYRQGLRLDPRHRASKWNLELALRLLKKEQEKKKKDQDKKKKDQKQDKKDQQKQQNNKDQQKQDNKDQQKQQKQDKKDQQKQQNPDKKEKKNQGPRQRPKPDRKEQPKPTPSQRKMNSVLDALDRNDRNLQRRRARILGGGGRRPAKDW
jgi:tetratricopeptide (TPR) repeat protein